MLILASSSIRRRQLLNQITNDFIIIESQYNEQINGLSPIDYALDCALNKAKNVFKDNKEHIILASDTIVVLNDEILLKPKSKIDAKNTLRKLSLNTHRVITSICIMTKDKTILDYETSLVTFKKLTIKEIDSYIATKSPFDKAGAYGIQDDFIKSKVEKIEGNIDNIIGLPINLVKEKLKGVKNDI